MKKEKIILTNDIDYNCLDDYNREEIFDCSEDKITEEMKIEYIEDCQKWDLENIDFSTKGETISVIKGSKVGKWNGIKTIATNYEFNSFTELLSRCCGDYDCTFKLMYEEDSNDLILRVWSHDDPTGNTRFVIKRKANNRYYNYSRKRLLTTLGY